MPLYWLCYHHNNQIAVVIEPAGSLQCEPHLKAEHMAAPTNAANVKKALANLEPSTHGRLCCKSLKTPGDKFPARSRNKPRSLIDVASGSLPKSPVSLSPGDEVPHMFTRKPRLQLEKFVINGAKRLLQHYRHF
jgi:hypothetical protein